jgi:hypothetical protein
MIVQTYKTPEIALKKMISNVNMASKVYESTFNVKLGLIKVDLQTTCDTRGGREWNKDCDSRYEITNRLSDFSKWRAAKGKDGTALWHLMTRCR